MRNAKAVLLEALLVAAIGLALALVANALSSRGLRLNRNYFPGGDKPTVVNPGFHSVATGSNAAPSNPLEAIRQRIGRGRVRTCGDGMEARVDDGGLIPAGKVIPVQAQAARGKCIGDQSQRQSD